MNFRGFIARYQDIFFYTLLERNLLDCASVLDVGCGVNSPISNVKKTFYSEGIDIFKQSIAISKKNKIHDKYIIGDILKLDNFYKPKTFDAVIALDVVEHLKKQDALRLIKKMERIARKKVILLTPNGYYHQNHLKGNPYQKHRSGWNPSNFRKLKYNVYGLRGLKYIRGEYATIRYKPWLFWGVIAFISEPMLYYFPRFSYHLFAIKNIISKL